MEVFVLFLVMAAIIAVQSLVFKKLSFKRLKYHCAFSTDEAFEEDEIELTETIENNKWLSLPWFKSEITTSKWLDFAGAQSTVTYHTRFVPSLFLIKGHKRVTRRWKVICAKRGAFSIEKVVLVSTDLLGSQTVSVPVKVESKILVLPKPFDLSRAFVNSRYLMGDQTVPFELIRDPFVISGVRDYQPSDPMKNIHWNATAKMNRIMIRNQEFTTRKSIMIALNMQSREYEKKETIDVDGIENCIRTVASVLDQTLYDSTPVSLAVNSVDTDDASDERLSLNYGKEHIYNLLCYLAKLPYGSSMNFSDYLKKMSVGSEFTDLILVTAYVNESIFSYCRDQMNAGKRVKILLLRDLGTTLPDDCDIYLVRSEVKQYA